jgi:hypothetical protein
MEITKQKEEQRKKPKPEEGEGMHSWLLLKEITYTKSNGDHQAQRRTKGKTEARGNGRHAPLIAVIPISFWHGTLID